MSSKLRVWELDDGSKWTTPQVAEKLGASIPTAYARLRSSSEPSKVFKPLYDYETLNGKRLYTLDDGSKWTSDMVVEYTGCLSSTASTRLTCYTDVERVLAPPKTRRENNSKEVREYIEKRNYFDSMGHWKLINSFT